MGVKKILGVKKFFGGKKKLGVKKFLGVKKIFRVGDLSFSDRKKNITRIAGNLFYNYVEDFGTKFKT